VTSSFDETAFDWDNGNTGKCQKHGVSLAEIEALFRSDPLTAPDPAHSDEEDRLVAVGLTEHGRPVFVIFTYRQRGGKQLIRPVSARYMRQKEYRRYAKSGH
jgi:uncharacterized DUF497 family protein